MVCLPLYLQAPHKMLCMSYIVGWVLEKASHGRERDHVLTAESGRIWGQAVDKVGLSRGLLGKQWELGCEYGER